MKQNRVKTTNNDNLRVAKIKLVDRVYQNSGPILVAEAILFSVAAVFMMVRPIEVLTAVTFAIGVVLVLFGLYRVSMVFSSNLGFAIGSFDTFIGLVTLVLGVVFCVFPRGASVGVIYAFVVLFLLNAMRMVFFSVNMARIGFGHYGLELIGAIVMLCLSIILLFIPNFVGAALVWCIAIYLLIYAAADVYMFIKLRQLRRRVSQQ